MTTSGTVLVLAGGVLAYAALFYVIVKIRRGDSATDEGEGTDRYLRRTDLLDDGDPPENVFEWIIVLSQRPWIQFGVVILMGTVTVVAAAFGYPNAAGLGAYGTMVGLLMLVYFHGWDRLEARFGTNAADASPAVTERSYDGLPPDVRSSLRTLESQTNRVETVGVMDAIITAILVIVLIALLGVGLAVLDVLL